MIEHAIVERKNFWVFPGMHQQEVHCSCGWAGEGMAMNPDVAEERADVSYLNHVDRANGQPLLT